MAPTRTRRTADSGTRLRALYEEQEAGIAARCARRHADAEKQAAQERADLAETMLRVAALLRQRDGENATA